jgi:Rrf2 family protein
MKLTTKGRYGLRFMMELAEHYGSGPVLVETISKNQNISANYIHVLVTSLKTAGLVRAVRGPNGGYELARDPASITVSVIIESLEGTTSLVDCASNPCSCPRFDGCAARELWSEVDAAVNAVLTTRTLADLAERQRDKSAAQVMFYI